MKKIYRSNIRTVLLGIVLPLWLISFLFGRNSIAVVDVASSESLTSNRSGEQQATERRAAMDLNVDGLIRRKFKAPKADPFALYVPKPRALPLVPPPPPPAPTAPALPFAFLGRMVESDNTTLFLSKDDKSYSVKINTVLDNNYRVDQINNDQVVFTYLPLNIQQTLSFGRAG